MPRSIIKLVLAVSLTISLFTPFAFAGEDGLSIVRLAFRDHVVTISSSSDGVLYSIHASSGALLGENLTDQELLAAYPELHSRIRSGYAGDGSGGFIWAGREESLVEPPSDFDIE